MPQAEQPLTRLAVHVTDRLAREAMAAALTGQPGIVVVGTAATAEELRILCAQRRPHVAVCHLQTPRSAAEACRRVRAVSPETRLVAVVPTAPGQIAPVPGLTLLCRSDGLKEVLAAVRGARGGSGGAPRLTSREKAIVYLTGAGLTTQEIARQLRLQPRTVENHKRHIYEKLGVNSQSHAVARTMSLGLLESPEQERSPSHTGLVLMRGRADACRDAVVRSMVRSRQPFMIAQRSSQDGRVWRHGGSVTVVLVDPEPEDWTLSISLGAPTLVVRCGGVGDPSAIADALAHGAHGLICADDVGAEFAAMLTMVSRGHFALSGVYAAALARWRPPVRPELTTRESEILASIARGDTIRQTARSLGIAVKTVENTQARLFRKLGARNRTETLTIADGWGLVPRCP